MKSSEYRGSGSLRIHAAHAILITIVIFCLASHLFGQSRTAAEVRGTVLDQQGLAVADATVTITNVLTGVSYKFTTNSVGLYDAPAVPLGKYTITFEKAGFERFERSGISLDIEVITINATLKVGSIHETMTVTGEASMVETDSPQGTTTVSGTEVQDTVNVGHSWATLLQLMPGVSAGGTGQSLNGGINASVNGEGVFEFETQVDGAHISGTDTPVTPSTGDPLDSVQEVKMLTSNFGAEYGSGLAVMNVVTKSGTNDWHGSVYEYTSTDKWNALTYNPYEPKALQVSPGHWDMYGLTLGGPIVRNKAFFFVSLQKNPSVGSWIAQSNTPTAAMISGNFSDPSLGGVSPIYDPATIVCPTPATCTEQQFPNNTIPSTRIDPVAQAIMNYLPAPNHAPAVANTPMGSDNYWWAASSPSWGDNFNFKVDYNVNPANRLTAIYKYSRGGTTQPNFPASIDNYIWYSHGPVFGLGDVWTFSPHIVGEFRLNAYPGRGLGSMPSDGQGFPAKLGMPYLNSDEFPGISIDRTSGLGLGPMDGSGNVNNIDNEGAAILSGKVTWVKGKHILKFGSEYDRWSDAIVWPSKDSGQFDFSGLFTQNNNSSGSPVNTGLGWADFLLGLPDNWWVQEAAHTSGKMYNLGAFVQDEYKIHPNLTLTLGVRWVVQSGWGEVKDRLADFDPTLVNGSPYVSPVTGQTSAQTLGGIWFAPQDGRRDLENTHYGIFDPRVGFAWVPFQNWSIRGGYGIYDEIWSGTPYYPGAFRGAGWSGFNNLTTTDSANPIFTLSTPTGNTPPPPGWNGQVGAPPIIWGTAANRTPSLYNEQGIFYAPQNTPIAYVEEYRLDLEHEIKGHMLIDVAYVGNSGHHYAGIRDINQIPQTLLGSTNSLTDASGNPINCAYAANPTGVDLQLCRPYPQYYTISTAGGWEFGNYNGLQASIRKQFANGLAFLTNYTWSHAMDTLTVGAGTTGIATAYQNVYSARGDYGAAQGDERQVLNGNVVYTLPFGKGKPLLNQGGPLNYVVGGWELSALFLLHTGIPITPTMSGPNNSYSDNGDGVWRPNQVGNPLSPCPTVNPVNGTIGPPYTPYHTMGCWYNWTVYQEPAAYTYGNTKRDSIYGPSWKQLDMSLIKNINIREKVNLKLKLEAFDALNYGNWPNPGSGIAEESGTYLDGIGTSTITSKITSRNVQVGVDFSF